jgi:hypothetical protein
MLKTLRKVARKVAHGTWIQMEESGAIMTGTPIELDPRKTGDKFQSSPFVRETFHADYKIRETRTVHRRRRA